MQGGKDLRILYQVLFWVLFVQTIAIVGTGAYIMFSSVNVATAWTDIEPLQSQIALRLSVRVAHRTITWTWALTASALVIIELVGRKLFWAAAALAAILVAIGAFVAGENISGGYGHETHVVFGMIAVATALLGSSRVFWDQSNR